MDNPCLGFRFQDYVAWNRSYRHFSGIQSSTILQDSRVNKKLILIASDEQQFSYPRQQDNDTVLVQLCLQDQAISKCGSGCNPHDHYIHDHQINFGGGDLGPQSQPSYISHSVFAC